MNYKFFSLLFLILSKVLADVSISKPTKGTTYTVNGDSVTVDLTWEESNAEPKLSEIESYAFTICTGTNSDIDGIKTLKTLKASDVSGNSYELVIPASIGASGSYFVQIYATTKAGYTINYSQRFSLKGMTGTKETSGSDETTPPNGQTSIDGSGQTSTLAASDLSINLFQFFILHKLAKQDMLQCNYNQVQLLPKLLGQENSQLLLFPISQQSNIQLMSCPQSPQGGPIQ